VNVVGRPPDYETYDYSREWKDKSIEDSAEKFIIKRWLTPSDSCLELGGGYGRITGLLERYFRRVVMVDASSSNLGRARKRLRSAQLVRSEFGTLPFPESSFDFIVTVRTIHHVRGLEAFFAEIRRVSKPRATLIMSVPNTSLGPARWVKEQRLVAVSPWGHRIYAAPMKTYLQSFEVESVLGAGIFENFLGRRLSRFRFLYVLDSATSPLWKLKPNVFLKLRVEKTPPMGQ
jgi:ubiquinone/menaquinone biosynthesis C-methylase UbiE